MACSQGVKKPNVIHGICFLNINHEPEPCPLAYLLLSADTSNKMG